MSEKIVSRPYPSDSPQACERCVWGRGNHASFCRSLEAYIQLQYEVMLNDLTFEAGCLTPEMARIAWGRLGEHRLKEGEIYQ